MDITKYILALIYENECVAVPGFGAFVSGYRPAQLDEKEENIFPPSKEITFDRKLKTNDWLLANFISASEGISRFEALKKIEEFCENIEYRLEKGESVIFDGLGMLHLDEKGNPVFTVSSDNNFLLDSYGLTSVPLSTHHKHKHEPKEPEPEEVDEDEEVQEKAGFRRWGWLLFFLLPLGGVALYLYLNFFTPKTHNAILPESDVAVEEPKTLPDSSANIETNQASVTNDSLPVAQSEPVKTEISAPQTGNYYLIGGSFKEQENVDKYIKTMEKEGYKPIDLGKQGNFFIVAIGVYETFEKANSAMEDYNKKNPGAGIWIKKITGN